MLSIGAIKGGQGAYYANIAREDYYTGRGEPPGHWWGWGATMLGLAGEVRKDDLGRLLAGFAPDGRPLVQNAGKEGRGGHQSGWDLTFSADKTVSEMWAQADPATQALIERDHAASVVVAFGYIQEVASFTRRGKAGETLEPCGLVVSLWQHGTNRNFEPSLHTHCLVKNVVVRRDGTTGTLVSKFLYQHKMAAGAVYRCELAARLERSLGVVCERSGTTFKVVGVPEKLCEFHSSRRAEIKQRLKEKGLASAAAAAVAALDTRKPKQEVPSREQLFARWRNDGRAFGFDLTNVIGRVTATPTRAPSSPGLDKVAQAYISRATRPFTTNDVVRAVAESTQARGHNAAAVITAARRALSQSKVARPAVSKGPYPVYATSRIAAIERSLAKQVRKLTQRRSHGANRAQIDKILARFTTPRSALLEELRHHGRQLVNAVKKRKTHRVDRPLLRAQASETLTPEQRLAVDHVTREGGRDLRFLDGGARKASRPTLRVAREIWERAGYSVVGVTHRTNARQDVGEAGGIKMFSARWLIRKMRPGFAGRVKHATKQMLRASAGKRTFKLKPYPLTNKTVLLIDIDGMDQRQLRTLLKHANRARSLVVVVGGTGSLNRLRAGARPASIRTPDAMRQPRRAEEQRGL